MTESETQNKLTKFGAIVLSMMAERGITVQSRLARLVTEQSGYEVSQRRMAGWLRGDHEPPWWFCESLAEIGSLTDEEMQRLAWANTYWQKRSVEE